MPCMCGDTHCWSCGPAQGNSKCWYCGAWADDWCELFEDGQVDELDDFEYAHIQYDIELDSVETYIARMEAEDYAY